MTHTTKYKTENGKTYKVSENKSGALEKSEAANTKTTPENPVIEGAKNDK